MFIYCVTFWGKFDFYIINKLLYSRLYGSWFGSRMISPAISVHRFMLRFLVVWCSKLQIQIHSRIKASKHNFKKGERKLFLLPYTLFYVCIYLYRFDPEYYWCQSVNFPELYKRIEYIVKKIFFILEGKITNEQTTQALKHWSALQCRHFIRATEFDEKLSRWS